MEEICKKLVSCSDAPSPTHFLPTQLAGGDTEVFLVSLTQQIESRQATLTQEAAANEVARILIHEHYRVGKTSLLDS